MLFPLWHYLFKGNLCFFLSNTFEKQSALFELITVLISSTSVACSSPPLSFMRKKWKLTTSMFLSQRAFSVKYQLLNISVVLKEGLFCSNWGLHPYGLVLFSWGSPAITWNPWTKLGKGPTIGSDRSCTSLGFLISCYANGLDYEVLPFEFYPSLLCLLLLPMLWGIGILKELILSAICCSRRSLAHTAAKLWGKGQEFLWVFCS